MDAKLGWIYLLATYAHVQFWRFPMQHMKGIVHVQGPIHHLPHHQLKSPKISRKYLHISPPSPFIHRTPPHHPYPPPLAAATRWPTRGSPLGPLSHEPEDPDRKPAPPLPAPSRPRGLVGAATQLRSQADRDSLRRAELCYDLVDDAILDLLIKQWRDSRHYWGSGCPPGRHGPPHASQISGSHETTQCKCDVRFR